MFETIIYSHSWRSLPRSKLSKFRAFATSGFVETCQSTDCSSCRTKFDRVILNIVIVPVCLIRTYAPRRNYLISIVLWISYHIFKRGHKQVLCDLARSRKHNFIISYTVRVKTELYTDGRGVNLIIFSPRTYMTSKVSTDTQRLYYLDHCLYRTLQCLVLPNL